MARSIEYEQTQEGTTPMQTIILPDGNRMRVSGLGERSFMGPWAHLLWLRTPKVSLRVQTAAVGSIEANESFLKIRSNLVDSIDTDTGYRIDIRESEDRSMTTFLVSWKHWELVVAVAGSNVPLQVATDLLSHFEFHDHPQGLEITPFPGLGAEVEVLTSVNSIEDVAGISVRKLENDREGLPLGTGTQAAGGERWSHVDRDDDGAVIDRSFVLANQSFVTDIVYDEKRIGAASQLSEELVISAG